METLNLKSNVWVKLTPAGVSALNQHIESMANRLLIIAGEDGRKQFVSNVKSWHKPEEGWYVFSIASFMQYFGPQLRNKSMMALANVIDSRVEYDENKDDVPLFENDEIHLTKPF